MEKFFVLIPTAQKLFKMMLVFLSLLLDIIPDRILSPTIACQHLDCHVTITSFGCYYGSGSKGSKGKEKGWIILWLGVYDVYWSEIRQNYSK